ncbi:hypothetical protein [Micromonospora maris]|uniref:Uncharacterized protein n=1 Tax=Micromonospora maris TaxID=1003110 RepID=A0A9X0LE77_9ACTN|nr:hypothetical protein [Micromonospora maris]AEB47846.1 hypothetical protein VAB18032_03820 [Micromonospora maris AB-18-032]KUJ46855.1 hypothetical protein ADL17_28800 [Micromonospora maris]
MRGSRRDGASPRDARLSGLEVWLTGTPAELDAATAALTTAGRVIQAGTRRPLTGTDASRHRLYLRLSIATAARPSGRASATGGAALLDLDTARRKTA